MGTWGACPSGRPSSPSGFPVGPWVCGPRRALGPRSVPDLEEEVVRWGEGSAGAGWSQPACLFAFQASRLLRSLDLVLAPVPAFFPARSSQGTRPRKPAAGSRRKALVPRTVCGWRDDCGAPGRAGAAAYTGTAAAVRGGAGHGARALPAGVRPDRHQRSPLLWPQCGQKQRARLHGSGAEAQQILLQGLEARDTRTPGQRQAGRPLRGLPRGAVLRGKRKAHQGPRGPAPVLSPPEGARAALALRPPRGGLLPAGRLRAAGRPGQPPPGGARRLLLPAAGLLPAIIAKRGSAYILRHAPALHREQRGLSPREAELRFIREACRLEDLPVHFFRLYKDKKEDQPTIILGLTLRGVQVFQEVNRTPQLLYDFPWPHVEKLAFLGEKFELWPHGQPAARRLVFRTGCAWRSRHLLRLLRTSHQLHLGLQRARQQLRQLEEAEEKQCYRESCVSDAPDADQDAEPAGSGDRAGAGGRPPSLRSRLSAGIRCSSLSLGFEVNPQRTGPAEPEGMSVDEPEGVAALPAEEPPSSPSSSRSSPGTVDSGRASPRQALAVVQVTLVSLRAPSAEATLHQILEPEVAAGHVDQHSRSLDHTRPEPAPRPAPRARALGRALDPGLRASVNSLSPSRLRKDQLPEEFVV
ncbi:FERM domain-containing protein 1 isoform 1-T1 [Dama dama]